MGQWANGQREGYGVLVNLEGQYMEGEWSRGELHGRGLILTDDARCYEGDLAAGQPSGKGCLTTTAIVSGVSPGFTVGCQHTKLLACTVKCKLCHCFRVS